MIRLSSSEQFLNSFRAVFEPVLEQFLVEVASRRQNFIYLKGYSELLSQYLYSTGDLFLMPSSFEPCGISQMLATRAGQPCLVHSVGGLADTVQGDSDGFAFSGGDLQGQSANMIYCLEQAVSLKNDDPKNWQKIGKAAAKARFLWSDVASKYQKVLYQ